MALNTSNGLEHEAATIKAAAALGTELSVREMAVLQAAHEKAPGRLDEIASIINDQTAHVAASPAVSPDLCAYLTRHSDPAIAISAASNPATSDQRFHAVLAQHPTYLGRSPKLPPETVMALAKRGSDDVRSHVAYFAKDAAVLRTLASDPMDYTRQKVARNNSADADTMLVLALDQYAPVRQAVAGHRQTPVEILHRLATDPEASVRKAVAGHKETPTTILDALSQDGDVDVRRSTAANKSTSLTAWQRLAQDQDEAVVNAVASTTSDQDLIRYLFDRATDESIAANPLAPTDVLDSIAERCVGLDLQRSCAEPLERDQWNIVHRLSQRENLSAGLVDHMIAWTLQTPCEEHEHCTTMARNVIGAARILATSKGLSEAQQLRLAEYPDPEVRRAVARRWTGASTAASVFERLAKDPDESVRKTVAENSLVPAEIREGLKTEFEKEVRTAGYAEQRRERVKYEANRNKLQEWNDKRKSKRTLKKFKKEHPELHAKMQAQVDAITKAING